MTEKNFLTIKEAIKKGKGKVSIRGWVYRERGSNKLKFIVLRDSTEIIQCVVKKEKINEKLWEEIDKIQVEASLELTGTIKEDKRAPTGYEVDVDDIKIIGESNEFPINKSLNEELLGDRRHLWLRSRKMTAVMKIRSRYVQAREEFFIKEGFVEIQPPCIISTSSEGGTELFEVKYFEKKAYLAQSPQLYKQMIACSMEKTFTITPVWRAEKHNTTRHINEIRQMDIEVAFTNQESIMKYLEKVLQYIVTKVLDNCDKELEVLGRKGKVKVPKAVYLHYEEAIKAVGGKVGEDFSPEQERKLCEKYPDSIVFTHSWPTEIKPFYIMPKDEKIASIESCGFDALYGGVEITSGGQRIHLPELLIGMIKKKGLNPKNFKDYIDSFRYGAPPHSGWSIGLERLTQMICGLDNIKEATMFPRDRDRLTP
ncbi:aspartate--tRNA(Asn) ligase [Candidatus Pacearchaeota archaeon CG10_big_fil_rev_8_21_14_0_10_35_13]|nr:MAG: aspartate--tRNA(Asn) ligase [Candidatus Pacearchaeota archaeon CG10_big_fil_rev_8_21_14_0_10_35_13]